MSQSSDVDKMVSDFLAELNALDQSLREAQQHGAADSDRIAADTKRPAEESNRAAVDSNPPAEDANRPAADTIRPAADPSRTAADTQQPAVKSVEAAPGGAAEVLEAPPPPEEAAQPAPYKPVRNIDVLLMDDAQPPPAHHRVEQPDDADVFQSCRSLYESRFIGTPSATSWTRVLLWAAGAVVLACIGWAVYSLGFRTRDPRAEVPQVRTPASPPKPAPEVAAITPASPIDKIEARRPYSAIRVRGVVEVVAEISEKGKVLRATPVSGPNALRAAAVRAVTKARFRPAQRNGSPVGSTITLSIPF